MTAAAAPRFLHGLKEVALTVGAVLGALCFAAAIASWMFGTTPLIVQSGSMEPAIRTGALVISRDVPASALAKGDIVTVHTKGDTTVTHRIVTITHRPGSATLQIKGDANNVPDTDLHTVKHAGRMVVAIPYAGHVAAFLAGPIGVFLLGAYVAFLVAVLVADWRSPTGGRRKATRGSAGAAVALLVASGTLAMTHVGPQPTQAAWTDTVNVGTPALSTYTVPVPANFSCTGSALNGVNFTWNAIAAPPGGGTVTYTLFYNSGSNNSGPITATNFRVTSLATISQSAWVRANVNFGSTTWNSLNSSTRNYTVALSLLGICL